MAGYPIDRIEARLRPGGFRLYLPALLGWVSFATLMALMYSPAIPSGLAAVVLATIVLAGFVLPCLAVSLTYAVFGVLQYRDARTPLALFVNLAPIPAMLLLGALG